MINGSALHAANTCLTHEFFCDIMLPIIIPEHADKLNHILAHTSLHFKFSQDMPCIEMRAYRN